MTAALLSKLDDARARLDAEIERRRIWWETEGEQAWEDLPAKLADLIARLEGLEEMDCRRERDTWSQEGDKALNDLAAALEDLTGKL